MSYVGLNHRQRSEHRDSGMKVKVDHLVLVQKNTIHHTSSGISFSSSF